MKIKQQIACVCLDSEIVECSGFPKPSRTLVRSFRGNPERQSTLVRRFRGNPERAKHPSKKLSGNPERATHPSKKVSGKYNDKQRCKRQFLLISTQNVTR